MKPYASTREGRTPGLPPTLGRHIPTLDGLRGLAILLVFLYHAAEWATPQKAGEGLLLGLFRSGWVGVDLFFVLSGFLITGILYDARGTSHAFRNFYMRRVLRIFPLYYAVLAVIFLVGPLLGWFDTQAVRNLYHKQGFLWTYTSNLYVSWVGKMVFKADWLNVGHFWSLAVEEHFYLFWPFLVLHLRRRTLIAVCLVLIGFAPALRLIFILSGTTWVAPYAFTLCRLDTLALGGLLAILARGPVGLDGLARWSRRSVPVLGIVLLGIFVVRGGYHPFDRWMHSLGFTVLAAFFGTVLVLVVTAPRGGVMDKVFGSRWMMAYGKYSYAIYVYHKVLESFVGRWHLHDRFSRLLGSRVAGDVAATTVLAAFFLGLGWLSWQLFEKQFLKLKRYFSYHAPAKRAGDPSARPGAASS